MNINQEKVIEEQAPVTVTYPDGSKVIISYVATRARLITANTRDGIRPIFEHPTVVGYETQYSSRKF